MSSNVIILTFVKLIFKKRATVTSYSGRAGHLKLLFSERFHRSYWCSCDFSTFSISIADKVLLLLLHWILEVLRFVEKAWIIQTAVAMYEALNFMLTSQIQSPILQSVSTIIALNSRILEDWNDLDGSSKISHQKNCGPLSISRVSKLALFAKSAWLCL